MIFFEMEINKKEKQKNRKTGEKIEYEQKKAEPYLGWPANGS
jgi:hypothetical protein